MMDWLYDMTWENVQLENMRWEIVASKMTHLQPCQIDTTIDFCCVWMTAVPATYDIGLGEKNSEA